MKITDFILMVIDHNVEAQPMPHHVNRDLMTTALKLERADNDKAK